MFSLGLKPDDSLYSTLVLFSNSRSIVSKLPRPQKMLPSATDFMFRVLQISGMMPFRFDLRSKLPNKSLVWQFYSLCMLFVYIPPFIVWSLRTEIAPFGNGPIVFIMTLNVIISQVVTFVTVIETALNYHRQIEYLTAVSRFDSFLFDKFSIQIDQQRIEKFIFCSCVIPYCYNLIATAITIAQYAVYYYFSLVDGTAITMTALILFESVTSYYPYFYHVVLYIKIVEERYRVLNEYVKLLARSSEELVKCPSGAKQLAEQIQLLRRAFTELHDLSTSYGLVFGWGILAHIIMNDQYNIIEMYSVFHGVIMKEQTFAEIWPDVIKLVAGAYLHFILSLSFHNYRAEVRRTHA